MIERGSSLLESLFDFLERRDKMLLHTKLVNLFATLNNLLRIEIQEIDNRMPPLNSPKTNVVYEGITDVNKCVAIVEHEFERLESMGYEPIINVYNQNKEINKLYEPTEKIRKSIKYLINIYIKN